MVRMTRMSTKKLGELLIEGGVVDKDKLEEALKQQKTSGELLGEVLVRLGWVTERDIAKTVATQFALPYLAVSQYFIPKEVLGLIPVQDLIEHQCVPIDRIGKLLLLGISGPMDIKLLERMESQSGSEICLYVSTASEIETVLDQSFSTPVEKPSEAEE